MAERRSALSEAGEQAASPASIEPAAGDLSISGVEDGGDDGSQCRIRGRVRDRGRVHRRGRSGGIATCHRGGSARRQQRMSGRCDRRRSRQARHRYGRRGASTRPAAILACSPAPSRTSSAAPTSRLGDVSGRAAAPGACLGAAPAFTPPGWRPGAGRDPGRRGMRPVEATAWPRRSRSSSSSEWVGAASGGRATARPRQHRSEL